LSTVRVPTDKDLRNFEPTATHEAIAGALNEPGSKTLIELSQKAGVSPRTVQRAISDPAALSWMVSQASCLAEARLGAIHARLLHMALKAKSPGWLKLYLERFDPEFKKQKILERGGAHQNNFIGDMDSVELVKLLQRKWRGLQGPSGTPPVISAPLPGLPGPDGESDDFLPAGDVGTGGDGC